VARYNGPGNNYDNAQALVADEDGNVYVRGFINGDGIGEDFATIKYDHQGNEQWVAHYSGPDSTIDIANAIDIDKNGNVYVTGLLDWDDYGTIKYDPDGNGLWIARYDYGSYDSPHDIKVDDQGNVFVTGESWGGSGSSYDIATVMYDPDGNELGVARYNNDQNDDEPVALELDGKGNVYVTGTSGTWPEDYDFVTVKYDSRGNELWAVRYDGPAGAYDGVVDLALDKNGTAVYVTGVSEGAGTREDYATIMYDDQGREVWVARYDGQGLIYDYDIASGLAVDSEGNVYVTGGSEGDDLDQLDYATLKYDPDGHELWVARYDNDGFDSAASDIALRAAGGVYVTGSSRGLGTSWDYATIRYDADGNELWISRYNGPGDNWDRPAVLEVDLRGNIYVTGTSDGNGSKEDYATVKYTEHPAHAEAVQR
jgi:hypothetical protein